MSMKRLQQRRAIDIKAPQANGLIHGVKGFAIPPDALFHQVVI